MRLTLRTLLAYLDDILETKQSEEIKEKISESSFASTLMNRIREVLRRRRLTAPDLTGPGMGLDPNVVAEYLDNTLAPDAVADVEKICLDSDVHLAEAAACHQVLTLVLGEAVEVSPRSRERMYALGAGSETPELPENVPADLSIQNAASVTESAETDSVVAAPDAASATIFQSLPDYLKPRPVWRRALPYVVISLVVSVWLGLFVIDPTIFPQFLDSFRRDDSVPIRRNEIAAFDGTVSVGNRANGNAPPAKPIDQSNPGAVTVGTPIDQAMVAENAAVVDQTNPVDSTETAVGSTETAVPVGASSAAARPGTAVDGSTLSMSPQQDATSPVIPEPAGAASVLSTGAPMPSGDESAQQTELPTDSAQEGTVVAVAPTVEPAISVSSTGTTAHAPQREVDVQYTSSSGVLLHYDPNVVDWAMLPHRSVIHPSDRIASPEPFLAQLNVGKGSCRITLLGGTVVTMLGPSQTASFGLDIQQGRVILQRGEPASVPADTKAVVLAVKVLDEVWRVELEAPGTFCGFEIIRREPSQLDQSFGTDAYTGGLYVVRGAVRFTDGSGREQVIESLDWLPLARQDRERAQQAAGPPSRPPLLAVPEWLALDEHLLSATQRRYASIFENEFRPDEPILLSLPTIVKSPRPGISELAVKCLALTDSYEALVQTLAEVEHEESRVAAIIGLRTWLPLTPENGELLKAALEKHFHTQDAEAVYRLLWGFNEKDASNPYTSKQLIEWLAHEHVAIRELAFYHIFRLVGQRYDYRPHSPLLQRQAAIARWQAHIEKKGALLAE